MLFNNITEDDGLINRSNWFVLAFNLNRGRLGPLPSFLCILVLNFNDVCVCIFKMLPVCVEHQYRGLGFSFRGMHGTTANVLNYLRNQEKVCIHQNFIWCAETEFHLCLNLGKIT